MPRRKLIRLQYEDGKPLWLDPRRVAAILGTDATTKIGFGQQETPIALVIWVSPSVKSKSGWVSWESKVLGNADDVAKLLGFELE